jgi:hypothetical protein
MSVLIEGNKYYALFQDFKKVDDSDAHEYTCWNPSSKMWWEGKVKIVKRSETDFEGEQDARAFFRTFPRSNVADGIKKELFSESLLLVRGRDSEGEYVNYRIGDEFVPKIEETIDYLLEMMYTEAKELGKDTVFPTIKIPLLERHVLAEEGLALPELFRKEDGQPVLTRPSFSM